MDKREKDEKPQKKHLHIAVVKQMVTLATSSFGLVAALAWNSVIQEFVNSYIKTYVTVGGGLISLFLYAISITILAVLVTYHLSQLLERLEDKEENS